MYLQWFAGFVMLRVAEDSALIFSFAFLCFPQTEFFFKGCSDWSGKYSSFDGFRQGQTKFATAQPRPTLQPQKIFPHTPLQTHQESANVCYKREVK